MVLAHLKKERFLEGHYNTLKLKKIGPYRILKKISANSYKLEMPTRVGISPIFNVVYLYHYVTGDIGTFVEGEYPTKDLQ